jgi:hypothetical protein
MYFIGVGCSHEVPGIIFIASLIPVYLQVTEGSHLQSTPLERLYTKPIDAATVGNISGTPFVE